VILINFPFSDARIQKRRPALIVATADFNDVIVCQITSNKYAASRSVAVTNQDFAKGSLPVASYVRPDKLFTLGRKLIIEDIATLKTGKTQKVLAELRSLFSGTKA